MKSRMIALACAALLAGATSAKAQQEVKIGVLYPLSGPIAQIGIDAVAAVKTVLEIVNEGADLPLPLAKGKGLPGLGGAKVEHHRRRPPGQARGRPERDRAPHHAGEGACRVRRLLLIGDRRGKPGGRARRHSLRQLPSPRSRR